jgi:dTDP-4-dehydrorhamnose reductase
MTNSTLLFGATSILGYALARNFPERILPFITPGSRTKTVSHWPVLKLDEPAWLAVLFERWQPDVLLYCHAVCDVPKCEAAPDWAREINVEHVRRVIAALPGKTRLVYISSDHVFGGDGVYDETAPPCPISVYGRTRVDAEKLVLARKGSLVVRVGLAIGPSPNGRTGHWDWLRYRLGKTLPVTIVDDEYRSVVWADDLAERIMRLSESAETGVRHIASTRVLSRIELADYLLSFIGMDATYSRESRYNRSSPHLGRVELATLYRGDLAKALPSVIDACPGLIPRLQKTPMPSVLTTHLTP